MSAEGAVMKGEDVGSDALAKGENASASSSSSRVW